MTLTVDRPRVVHTAEETAPVEQEEIRRTSGSTREDLLTLIGAGAASLATTWVFYSMLLPFEGAVGFVVVWYVVFVAFYAGLTALTQPRTVVADRVVTTAVIAAPALVGLALGSVVVMTLIVNSVAAVIVSRSRSGGVTEL